MAQVTVQGDELVIQMEGFRKLLTLKGEMRFPLQHVLGATVDPGVRADFPKAVEKRAGSNVWQTYYGGTFVQHGDRVFWDVRRPENAIVITLADEAFSQLVVEVPDPQDAVEQIERATSGNGPEGES